MWKIERIKFEIEKGCTYQLLVLREPSTMDQRSEIAISSGTGKNYALLIRYL